MKRIVVTFVAILALQGILLAQTAEPRPKWLAERVTHAGLSYKIVDEKTVQVVKL